MKDLATKIKDIIEYKGEIIWDTSKPNGQPRRSLDTTKAEKDFGFKAATSLDEGLKQTCEWYLKGIGRRFEFIYNQENEK